MNATHFSCRLSATRHILARSIATLLLAGAALIPLSHADDTVTFSGGTLKDTLNAAGDGGNVLTDTSGSNIDVSGTGLSDTVFSNVTAIDGIFSAANQTFTFDSTLFSFTPKVTISTGSGAASDAVDINGSNAITFTGVSNYGGGTSINGGQVIFNNASALGTGPVSLASNAELTGSGTLTFLNTVNFIPGTTNATLAATAGSTITFGAINSASTTNLTFGSAGNTGEVVIGLLATSVSGTVTVADGTLTSGAGGAFDNLLQNATSTTIDSGAKMDLRDDSTAILGLQGAGTVNLGSKNTTVLTLTGADFSGVISGAGKVNVIGAGRVIYTGANTYTGGTTIAFNSEFQLGNGGSTGSVAGNVSTGVAAFLVFDRSNPYTFSGVISGSGGVVQSGDSILTLSGNNSYSGGTQIESGDVVVTNNNALGLAPVGLRTGAELRASGTVTLNNTVNFAAGTTNATLSAVAGGTLTLNNLNGSNAATLTFGSMGATTNTGTVAIGPGATTNPTGLTGITVAFGTLANAGGLNALTSGDVVTTVDAAATLGLNDNSTKIAGLFGSGDVTLGSKSTTVLTLPFATFGGVISGAGQVNVIGGDIFTGANTYTGSTTIAANSGLQLGNDTATGSIMGNVSVASGGVLAFHRSNPYTFSGVISGAGTVLQQVNSILTLSGNNTYSGGTQIESGDLVVTNNNALGTGPVALIDGTELRGMGTVTLNNTVNFATGTTNATLSAVAGGTLTLNDLDISNTTALTFGSTGNNGLVIIGPNAANTVTGNNITVAFGVLRNGDGLSVLTDAGNTTTVNAKATLDLHDISTGITSLAGSGSVTLGTQKTTVLAIDGGTFDGVISGAGSLNIGNLLTFTGANTYTGGTTVTANSDLQLGNATTTGSVAGNVSLKNNADLIFDRSNAYTFGGIISGAGFVEQNGAGVLTLSGNNTYAGGTLVNSGVLVVTNAIALGTGPVTLSNGAELRGSGIVTLKTSSVAFASGTNNATISAAPGGTLTLNNLDATNATFLTFGSAGNTGKVVIGAGAKFSPAAITIAFGTLQNGGGLSAPTAPSPQTTVNAGATLAVNDTNATIGTLEGSGSITLGSKSTTVLTLNDASFGGIISGAGQVNVSGGTILTGANTYTGGTTIAANQFMELGKGGTTGSIVGPVSIASGGALDFDRSNADNFSGNISGLGGVRQTGAGVLTLSGNNTYTGGTQINSGVLVVTNNNSLGSGPVTLSNGAELRGSGTVTLNTNGVAFASGTNNATISAAPGGTLTLNNLDPSNAAGLTFGSAGNTGKVVIGAGAQATLADINIFFGTLQNGGSLSVLTAMSRQTTVNPGATVAVNDTNTTVNNLVGSGAVTLGSKSTTVLTLFNAGFGGIISGAGQVNVMGGATFTGANTYTGGTTIPGKLQLGNGGSTGSVAGNVTISDSSSVLAFDRSNADIFGGGISGAGGVQQDGTGVLTLSGKNTYTGGTQINSGVLVVPNAGALGTGPVTLGDSAEFRSSGTILFTDPITYNGTASATISTSGILTLPNLTDSGTGTLIFGSSGNAGTVGIPSTGTLSYSSNAEIIVAFGTLSNGGGLNTLTSSAFVTQVNQGATINLSDFNTTMNNLTGAGTVKLGTKSSTVLTIAGAFFRGTISGAGQVNATGGGSGLVDLLTASTYTGGTTVSAGGLVANNPSGSATGTGPVTIDSGATIGGSGTVSGAITLDSGGTVKPGVNDRGRPGTQFHGSSLLMEGGSTLDLQIGSTTDEILLTGALTKGTGTGFTIDIENDTIVTGDYTLATFASTTFSLSDFTLDLPNGVSAILVENSKSLVLDISQAELPAHSEETSAPADSDLATASTPTLDSSFTPSEPLQPTPEPGSALLLAFGGAILLGWRRQTLNEAA